jgi:hypothetical protein
MDRKKNSKHYYNCPMDQYGPYVHEVKIGSLNLYEGQRFLYLFDFGDEWEFDIQTMKIIQGESRENLGYSKGVGKHPTNTVGSTVKFEGQHNFLKPWLLLPK